jgi:hypothetical protein
VRVLGALDPHKDGQQRGELVAGRLPAAQRAPGTAASGPTSLHGVDGQHPAASIDDIALCDGEGRRERAPSRREAVTGGEFKDVMSQLPAGFSELVES